MIIQAKFKSVCPTCQKDISIGENVEWKKGSKATHEACNKLTTPAKKVTKPSKPQLEVAIFEKGFHIKGVSIKPVIHGNITSFIKETLYNKDAEKFLNENGYKFVLINGNNKQWVHENKLTKENGYDEKMNRFFPKKVTM